MCLKIYVFISIYNEETRLRDFSEAARLPSVTEFKRPLSTSVNEWLLSADERGTTSDCPLDPFNSSPCDERLDHGEEIESSCWFSNTDCAHTVTDWDNQQSLKSVSGDPSTGSDVSELALWLQLTYALEMQQYSAKKIDAESHLQNIRQACKRLHRKRYTILGSVRLIHSDSLDDLERRLVQAKLVLEQLQHEMRERHRRWARIEALLGLKLRNNLGPARIQHLLTTGVRSPPADQHSLIPGPECEFKSSEPRETEEPGDTEGEQGLCKQQLLFLHLIFCVA
ncbi:unnamed protein product [Echinostoma caproni]|uniref:STIM1/2 Orai1-activating region domain-containing protein n=1 Tax=Echinostoma caproni TaxID=27848 RepID=A0A3P8L8N7_9TREM|nr:unnamed protein product [Echinostoma caproni]